MIKKLTKKQLEKKIETEILRYLNTQGDIFAFKVNTVGVYDSKRKVYRTNKNPFLLKGTADIIGMIQGRLIAIEVKRPKETPTDEQWAFLQKVVDKGGYAAVAYSLDQAIQFIELVRRNIALWSKMMK